jgi:hypothetical protein
MIQQSERPHALPKSGHFRQMWFALCAMAAIMWFVAIVFIIVPGVKEGRGIPGLIDGQPGKRDFFVNFPAYQDLTIYRIRFELYHSSYFYEPQVEMPWPHLFPEAFAYPPAGAVIYSLFYLIGVDYIENTYLGIFAFWLLIASIVGWTILSKCGLSVLARMGLVASLFLFVFPIPFLIQRANLEIFTWMGISLGLWIYSRRHYHAAAFVIGAIAAIKLYPIILLGIFLHSRRKSYAVLTGIAAFVLITAISLWWAGPTFHDAAHGFFTGVSAFKTQHAEAARSVEGPLDHSLFAAVKIFYMQGGDIKHWMPFYYAGAAIATVVVFFTRVRKMPFLNRLAFCMITMMILPPVSYEYTIVHPYVILLLILRAVAGRTPNLASARVPLTLTVSTAAILITMSPIFLLDDATFLGDGLIQLAALLTVWISAACVPWPTTAPYDQEDALEHVEAAPALPSAYSPA